MSDSIFPLFHAFRGALWFALVRVIHEAVGGSVCSREMLRARLGALCPAWRELSARMQDGFMDALFDFNAAGRYVGLCLPYSDVDVTLPPMQTELRWIKTMALDMRYPFLLPRELRRRLCALLPNVDPLVPLLSVPTGQCGNMRVMRHIETLRTAFLERRQVFYRMKKCGGDVQEGTVFPCRMVYDLSSDAYMLLVWDAVEGGILKLRLSQLSAVRCVEAPIPEDMEAIFQAFLNKKRRSLRLRVHERNNAVERCFLLFGSYDKEAYREGRSYVLTVRYYAFDTREVFEKVLSLGAAVEILSPTVWRERIRNVLRQAAALYERG